MERNAICDMDCFHCVYADCINDAQLTRQGRYYWRNREKILQKKKEAYKRKKEERDGQNG